MKKLYKLFLALSIFSILFFSLFLNSLIAVTCNFTVNVGSITTGYEFRKNLNAGLGAVAV